MTPPQKPQYAEPGLDAYRRTDQLATLQTFLIWLVPLVVLVWSLVQYFFKKDGLYSPGPMASAHAMWQDRCDVCHVTSQPISAHNWLGKITSGTHAADDACMKCHQGPPHNTSQKMVDIASCAACHSEHRGEHALLIRVGNEQCTRCHQNLEAHIRQFDENVGHHPKIQIRPEFMKVTAFDGNKVHHPDYKSDENGKPKLKDSGQLKFNHKMHMTPGIYPSNDKASFLGERIPLARWKQYGLNSAKLKDPVKLECSSCHQLDAGSLPLKDVPLQVPAHASQPARSSGAYLVPITYEVHCQACHPLAVGHTESVLMEVPHRLTHSEMHEYLEGFFTVRYLKKKREPKEKEELRPLPGRQPHPSEPLEALEEAVKNPVRRAEQMLYETRTGCFLCHHIEQKTELAASKIVPTNVPSVWLKNASFNHLAHRLWDCRSCHPKAYPFTSDTQVKLNPEASEKASDVLLPGIDTCFKCHSSALPARARSDCVECHRYHNGDHPLQGKGASIRGAKDRMPIEDFLTGQPNPNKK